MPSPVWSTADQWTILWPVLLALVLSTAIGLERELELVGRGDLGSLAGELAELPGVRAAHTGPADRD